MSEIEEIKQILDEAEIVANVYEKIGEITERVKNKYIPVSPKLQPESNPIADLETCLSHISTLDEKVSYWKHAFDLEVGHSKQAESRIKVLEEAIENVKEQAGFGMVAKDKALEELYKTIEKI